MDIHCNCARTSLKYVPVQCHKKEKFVSSLSTIVLNSRDW